MAQGFAPTFKSEKHPGSTPPQPLQSLEVIQDNLLSSLEEIQGPRSTRTQKHLLKDILVIAILAALAGAEGWEDMENYGISKSSWLKEFLELPNGIPSDDPFRRVFERL